MVTVRVTRSFDKRVDWLMDHLGTDDEAFAGAELRRSDDAHAARMHALFGVTWGDPLLYDLVLNTDRVSRGELRGPDPAAGGAAGVPGDDCASQALLADLALAAAVRARA